METGFLAGKRILLIQQRDWGFGIGRELARRLDASGARLAAITSKQRTHEAIMGDPEPYEFVVNWDSLFQSCSEKARDSGLTVADVCKGLGIKTIWPLVQSLRHHARSYGERYYYSFRQNIDDDGIRAYLIAEYAELKKIFDEFQPDLVVSLNFGASMHIMAGLLAAQRGARMTAMAASRIPDVFISCWDELQIQDRLGFRISEMSEAVPTAAAVETLAEVRGALQGRRGQPAGMRRSPTFVQFAKSIAISLLRKRRVPGMGPTVDWQPLGTAIRHFLADHLNRRRALRRTYDPLPDRPYAFMGLQFQPEMTMDVISPFFSNQLETARQVAMSLPGDLTLVVKDHPQLLGLRRPSYLEKLARLPNVVLADPRIDSVDLLEGAECLIAVGGSMIGEAAWLGIPAIQLGPHGLTRRLPNVRYNPWISELTTTIEEVVRNGRFEGAEYDRKLGLFVQAVQDVGIEGYFSHYKPARPKDFEATWQWYLNEFRACFAHPPVALPEDQAVPDVDIASLAGNPPRAS